MEIGDATIFDGPVDDVTAEFGTARLGARSRRIGVGTAEGPELPVAADQQIQGPASGSTELEGAGANGVALVRKGRYRALLSWTPNNSLMTSYILSRIEDHHDKE